MRNIERNVMKAVKIDRKVLLATVRENATKHLAAYDESVEDYKAAVFKIAKANLKLAASGELDQFAKIKVSPSRPVCYADNYTRAIRMLELSVDDTIEVEEDVFNQLVLDEWHWKNSFVTSASFYKSI